MMERNQVRHLVVLNHDKLLSGIVPIRDLATKAGDRTKLADAVERISEPALH